jgi:hypothetical protein
MFEVNGIQITEKCNEGFRLPGRCSRKNVVTNLDLSRLRLLLQIVQKSYEKNIFLKYFQSLVLLFGKVPFFHFLNKFRGSC